MSYILGKQNLEQTKAFISFYRQTNGESYRDFGIHFVREQSESNFILFIPIMSRFGRSTKGESDAVERDSRRWCLLLLALRRA